MKEYNQGVQGSHSGLHELLYERRNEFLFYLYVIIFRAHLWSGKVAFECDRDRSVKDLILEGYKVVRGLFKFGEGNFLQILELLFSEELLNTKHKYRTNIDIASMLVAWGLEVGKKEEVEWVVKGRVEEEWLYGLW